MPSTIKILLQLFFVYLYFCNPAWIEIRRTSKMRLFAKIVNGLNNYFVAIDKFQSTREASHRLTVKLSYFCSEWFYYVWAFRVVATTGQIPKREGCMVSYNSVVVMITC